jgi:hypothetical protein
MKERAALHAGEQIIPSSYAEGLPAAGGFRLT